MYFGMHHTLIVDLIAEGLSRLISSNWGVKSWKRYQVLIWEWLAH
jgi:hypothetical protein